jgi:hypothetical protein
MSPSEQPVTVLPGEVLVLRPRFVIHEDGSVECPPTTATFVLPAPDQAPEPDVVVTTIRDGA